MTVTTEDGGRTNIYAKEKAANESTGGFRDSQRKRAELELNGRVAMLGVIAAIGAYALTGQLIPEIF